MLLQRALLLMLFGLVQVAHGKLVFNEVMIHPINAVNASSNWFEVYNTEITNISLDGRRFFYCSTIRPTCPNVFLSTNKTVGPFGLAVIGNNNNSTTNGGVAVDVHIGFESFPTSGSNLKNAIALYPPGASFDDVFEWSIEPPFLDTVYMNHSFVPGASLARISTDAPTRNVSNWQPSTDFINCTTVKDKGTPGKINTNQCPKAPTKSPSKPPTKAPSKVPTKSPVKGPSKSPTRAPMTKAPTRAPSKVPTKGPTKSPTLRPVVTTRSPVTAPVAIPTPTLTAPVQAPTKKKCGLFRLGFLCLNGCGILGRLLGLCKQ